MEALGAMEILPKCSRDLYTRSHTHVILEWARTIIPALLMNMMALSHISAEQQSSWTLTTQPRP